jgi:glyoxylase-like metal-dependent hydrolase (beta-lactamase superfamily II)
MSGAIFHSRLIHTNTWLILGDGSNSYLVVGDKWGLMIDTGFATENIQVYAQSLTDKPVIMAANTHGHFDHTGGNGWFTHAYMSAKALEIAKVPYASLDASKYPTEYIVTIVGDGDKIDFGDRTLDVIEIPAHAPSSIAFLDRKERIMFTGDEVGSGVMLVWMQDEPQPTVEQHANNMEKLLLHRHEFDFICGGHDLVMEDASIIEDYLEHDRRIMSGMEGIPWTLKPGYPADFHMPQPKYKRISVYKNTSLGYDVRYVYNKVSQQQIQIKIHQVSH